MPSKEINWNKKLSKGIILNTENVFHFKVHEDYYKPKQLSKKEFEKSNEDYFLNLFYLKESFHPGLHPVNCFCN